MAVSLKSVAEEAKVSIMTASKILNLNEAHRFRPETVERVEAVGRRLGYTPDRSAQFMRTQRSGIIGMVARSYSANICRAHGHPLYFFQAGLCHELGLANQHLALVEWTELEPKNLGEVPLVLRQRFFDGLVIHFDLSKQAHNLLNEFEVPLVYVDCGISEPYNCLVRDERRAMIELVERMIDYGYRRIAFYLVEGVPQDAEQRRLTHFSLQTRRDAYLETVEKRGFPRLLIRGNRSEPLIREMEEARIDAIVIQGNGSASFYYALNCLAARGQLIAYASSDVETNAHSNLDLAGMRFNRYDAGRVAARMLQTAITSKNQRIPSATLDAPFVDGITLPKAG